jgi:predicted tellurium resistance membrane protein TerC
MNLTDSEKVFFECFEIIAKRPYLGYLAGVVLFFIGLTLYSKGMRLGQSGKILIGGIFFGLSLFEIIESYIMFRLYQIIEKMKS